MKLPIEKFCPVCKNKNQAEATVCFYCGASLEDLLQPDQTTVPLQDGTQKLSSPEGRLEKLASGPLHSHGLALYIMGDSKPVALLEEDEIILGRQTAEGPSNIFDLSPYGAFEMGVSRQHVLIRMTGDGYEVIDLNSTNGTWLNESQIVPNRPYPLRGNVQIRLGKLAMFLIYGKAGGG